VLKCVQNNQPINEEKRARALWTWCGRTPITEKVYRDVAEKGLPWPGDSPAVRQLETEGSPAPDSKAGLPGYLSNMPPDDESLEGLKAQIEYLNEAAAKLVKAGAAKTQVLADEAAHLAETLRKAGIKADGKRKEEKAPFDAKVQEVQDRWNPILAKARIFDDVKKKVVAPFLDAENRRLAAEAEAQRRAGQQVEEPKKATAGGGGGGRKVHSVPTKTVRIVDYDLALKALGNHQFVQDAVLRAAQAMALGGMVEIAGCEITEGTSAR